MKPPRDPRLDQYLALCRRMFERMQREETWPWPEVGEDDGADLDQPDNKSNDI